MDKASACLRENISVLLDDSLENCMAAVQNGIPAVLFDSKGNQSVKTKLCRVPDWSAALQAVSFAERGYPDRKTAEQLLCAAQAVIGSTCFQNGLPCISTCIKMPKGTKAAAFWKISLYCTFPFTISDAPNGIRLIFRISGRVAKENCILNTMIHVSMAM